MALLHAHQMTGVLINDEGRGRLAVMVSRSADGELAIPAMKVHGLVPVRGSGGRPNKGGAQALRELEELVRAGHPALLTVDGPRGPRNGVKPGTAVLASRIPGCAVLPIVARANRRHILRSWDRLQIPLPGARIELHFAEPIFQEAGEDVEALRARVEQSLCALERRVDPEEAPASTAPSSPPSTASRLQHSA